MPKRKAKKKKTAASKSYLDTLVAPDHRLETANLYGGSVAPVVSAEYRAWLEADLLRLEAAWPHVGTVGLARDRMKRAPLWPAEVGASEGEADTATETS